jgi:hypothetical protein
MFMLLSTARLRWHEKPAIAAGLFAVAAPLLAVLDRSQHTIVKVQVPVLVPVSVNPLFVRAVAALCAIHFPRLSPG